MNAMVRLLGFYEMARHKLNKPIGEIFPYLGNATGLQMLGEFIARACSQALAVMVFPAHGTENFMFLPSGKFRHGFQLDGKVNQLFEDQCFVIVLQKEKYLSFGNYIVLKMPYDGNVVHMYHITAMASKPLHITDFHLEHLESHVCVLKTALKVCLEESEEVMKSKGRTAIPA